MLTKLTGCGTLKNLTSDIRRGAIFGRQGHILNKLGRRLCYRHTIKALGLAVLDLGVFITQSNLSDNGK